MASHSYLPWTREEDKKAVLAVLDSGIMWGGEAPQAKALEQEWANHIGTKYCLAANSGTAALHMAVAADANTRPKPLSS